MAGLKDDILVRARSLSAKPVGELRSVWRRCRASSGLSPSAFRQEVATVRNVADGRCPDGCCGNEEAPPWSPSPAEWAALAEHACTCLPRKARRP